MRASRRRGRRGPETPGPSVNTTGHGESVAGSRRMGSYVRSPWVVAKIAGEQAPKPGTPNSAWHARQDGIQVGYQRLDRYVRADGVIRHDDLLGAEHREGKGARRGGGRSR